MKIVFSKRAVKALDRMDSTIKQRIGKGISGLPKGDIKKLQGHTDLYRLRIGDWRIVYSYMDANTILIENIDLRGQVYKGV